MWQGVFTEKISSLEDARAFGQDFFPWYNDEHHLLGIGYLTPDMVHSGKTAIMQTQRQNVLDAAFDLHPERFVVRRTVLMPSIPKAQKSVCSKRHGSVQKEWKSSLLIRRRVIQEVLNAMSPIYPRA